MFKPIHVVAAVIWHPSLPNHFLIARRLPGKHLAGFWELPGGKVETGESREDALKRELAEEISIIVITMRSFMDVTHRYEDRTIFLDVWFVDAFEGQVESREQQELKWVDTNDLNDYSFPEADQPVLKAITNNGLKGNSHSPCIVQE
ncbi:MAG: 8-oxo-dGTP diphosphatase [Gammaproteobacteria bacterium]|jgi:8-oxo-dGTP diphosphatase